VELPDHGRGHRAERVVRARVSHVNGHDRAATDSGDRGRIVYRVVVYAF
jgi:hypothetical protein